MSGYRYLTLVPDDSWREHAACAGVDPDLFFPEHGGRDVYHDARETCRACPVRHECLQHALDTREEFGMWGGLNPGERLRLISQRRRAGAPIPRRVRAS